MIRIRLLSIAAVSLLGAGLVAGCGGDDEGGDEDPQQVLDETFSNEQAINSGVLDLSLAASAEGDEGGSIDASLTGPFQGEENKTGEFPQLDLNVSASGEGGGQSFDFEGGLIATADQLFVGYQDTTYEVPKQFFDQIKQVSEQAQRQAQSQGSDQDAGAIFEQFGIDPSKWLTNLENEGDEDVEGTETVHIHGDANVQQILEDLQSAAQRTGADDSEIDPDEIAEVEDAIDEASIDVYSGADDNILRRLDVNLALTPPEDDDSGVDSLDIEFSLTFSGVNEEQTIEAPGDAQPFSRLEQDLGLPPGLLEGALEGGGLNGGGLGGGGLGGGGGGGGAGKIEGAPGIGNQKYLNCIAQAQTPEELQDCNP